MKTHEENASHDALATLSDKLGGLGIEAHRLADTLECLDVAGANGDPAHDLYAPGVVGLVLDAARRLQDGIEDAAMCATEACYAEKLMQGVE